MTYSRQLVVIERNLLLAEASHKELEGSDKQSKPTKPEDLIKLYEGIYQNWLEVRELPGISDDAALSSDIDVKVDITKAFRCFYAGWAFELGQKWAEALSLYTRAGELAAEGKKGLQTLSNKQEVRGFLFLSLFHNFFFTPPLSNSLPRLLATKRPWVNLRNSSAFTSRASRPPASWTTPSPRRPPLPRPPKAP